jgi:cytidylate kinase
MVIAIDGPAGAGKSTIGRALARVLDLDYLDTGAMYRAVAWLACHNGVDLHSADAVTAVARAMTLEQDDAVVRVDGHDVTTAIRTTEMSEATSIVAAHRGVRAELRARQRAWARDHGGGVIEGRDIGTVVFPDAFLKVYLEASPRVRAERRVAQNGGDVADIERSIAERDTRDSTRADGPLQRDGAAVHVDTSHRTIEDVVAHIVSLIEARR